VARFADTCNEEQCQLSAEVYTESSGDYKIVFSKAKLELELIQTQMTQKPMLRAEVGMRVRCANKASAESQRQYIDYDNKSLCLVMALKGQNKFESIR